jgi:hypothetical protein
VYIRKFLGVGGSNPPPPNISCPKPSLSLGESAVKIPTRKTENDVSWRGPKVGIPQIPLIPGGPPEDLEKNFCGAALDPDQDYQVASKKVQIKHREDCREWQKVYGSLAGIPITNKQKNKHI